ncbi:hypothetical protein L4D08_26475 [Photobacterium chitinilyticum]|uniref:hypothetical protein n=1 Tax=Photobacterium chitinilyticum TaxID=2485123 RepID=UPI003D150803
MKKFVLLLVLLSSGCSNFSGFMKYNSEVLSTVQVANNECSLFLDAPKRIKVIRGALDETQVSFFPKGEYKLLLESELGSYFLSLNDDFRYTDYGVGGVFIPKNGDIGYVWIYLSTSYQEAINVMSDHEIVESFKSWVSIRPLIDDGFEIKKSLFSSNSECITKASR